jgi:hypothetical protein
LYRQRATHAAGPVRAPSDTGQRASQKAGPSGLIVREAVLEKPLVEGTAVQELRTVKFKELGAVRFNLRKV